MSEHDEIPSHWINKAGIAKRIGKSRITVDKLLSKIEKDPILSTRLNVKVIVQGKRNLYYYDPSDIDAVFAETNKDKKSRSRNVNSRSSNSSLNVAQHVSNDLQHQLELEQIRRISLEKEVARLEAHNKDLQDDVVFFKAQLTDQRSATQKITEPAPEPTPEPATVAPKAQALPTELDPDHPDHPDNVVSLPTAKVEKAIKEAEQVSRDDIEDGTLEDVMEHFDPMNSAELALLDEEIEANKKAKNISPEPQSNPSAEADTQPSEEATAKEERRNNITSKPEPVKRSLWQKIKDNW